VPRAVLEGYSTILWEIDDALAERGEPGPDLVLMQVGVGAFAAAVTRHFRRPGLTEPPRLVSVEPSRAACVLESIRAGELITLPGEPDSIMSGLNCGTPSLIAFGLLQEAVDAFVAIDDEVAREGMRALRDVGIAAGECSGGGVGAALRLLGPGADPRGASGSGRTRRPRAPVPHRGRHGSRRLRRHRRDGVTSSAPPAPEAPSRC
jgi:diaminopropionate ammonia-lyase